MFFKTKVSRTNGWQLYLLSLSPLSLSLSIFKHDKNVGVRRARQHAAAQYLTVGRTEESYSKLNILKNMDFFLFSVTNCRRILEISVTKCHISGAKMLHIKKVKTVP